MCGRFTLTEDILALQDFFQFEFDEEIVPRYNIAPGQDILTIMNNGEKRVGKLMRWGFIPYWAKDEKIGYKMINARGETVDEKPSFKYAFRQRRCLILADGYYEWKKTEDGKQPYRFIMKDNKPFAFAGLWEVWSKGKKPVFSSTIITTEANEVTRDVHHRMPVILPEERFNDWLDPNLENVNELKSLFNPYPDEKMEKYPVSTAVNSGRVEHPDLIKPLNSL